MLDPHIQKDADPCLDPQTQNDADPCLDPNTQNDADLCLDPHTQMMRIHAWILILKVVRILNTDPYMYVDVYVCI